MLCPRLSHSLLRCPPRQWCVLYGQRRCSSTLGDISAFLATQRAKAKTLLREGDDVQLCITEDMRVFVEHRGASSSEGPRLPLLAPVWQGSATSTIAEALRSLLPGAAQPPFSASTPSLGSAVQPRTPPARNSTLLDLSRVSSEETRGVLLFMENAYPSLRLDVQHTSGKDLQGTRLHTIHVQLVPRAGGMSSTRLSGDDQRLVDSFKGEGVGEGYNGCLRRALKDAFAAAKLPYPTDASEDAQSATLLSLYAQTWEADGFELCLSPSASPSAYAECAVRSRSTGRTLHSTTLPLTAEGLRDLLKFCDRSAASHRPDRHMAVIQRVRGAPLHLVLPRSQLRVKQLLRKLLFYHYGCVDSDIAFNNTAKPDGLFAAEIAVTLPSHSVTSTGATPVPRFVVANTTGTARKRAMELAAVQAMQTLFPEIFERQIAYHNEIREIQQCSRASASEDVPPHTSRGLEAQVKWALQASHQDFAMESVLLKPNTPYSMWGVSTGTSTVWLSQLFILTPPSAAAPTGEAVRELCTFAFDSRKSRSEQKAIAAALAQRFPDRCKECVQDAKERKLIDEDGAPAAFEGVRPLQDRDAECFAQALCSDPCLATLPPTRSLMLQQLPLPAVRHSALAVFWAALERSKGDGQLSVRVQRGAGPSGYTAACVTVETGRDEVGRVVCEAAASTEIGAIFALLQTAHSLLPSTSSPLDAAGIAGVAGEADALPCSVQDFLDDVPTSLPTSTPLQTCVDAVSQLYGLRCAVRILQEGAQYTGELWGSSPADSVVLRRSDRIHSSPFSLDRNFLLGRGSAESPLMAVVRAAQNVFEGHVRVHQRAFHDVVVSEGLLYLHPAENGSLAKLRDAVLTEIKATSDKAITDSALTIRFQHGQLYELSFTVSAGVQSIKLEETVSRHFLDALREFCQRVSAETGIEFVAPSTLASINPQSASRLLQQLCQLAYGFDLRVDTQQVHNRWYCRLSIPLTGELACCVAEASASRKKDAVDAAAVSALTRHFSNEVGNIPSYHALCLARGTEVEKDAVQTDTENYIFNVTAADEAAALGI